jgi:hypothetical protein
LSRPSGASVDLAVAIFAMHDIEMQHPLCVAGFICHLGLNLLFLWHQRVAKPGAIGVAADLIYNAGVRLPFQVRPGSVWSRFQYTVRYAGVVDKQVTVSDQAGHKRSFIVPATLKTNYPLKHASFPFFKEVQQPQKRPLSFVPVAVNKANLLLAEQLCGKTYETVYGGSNQLMIEPAYTELPATNPAFGMTVYPGRLRYAQAGRMWHAGWNAHFYTQDGKEPLFALYMILNRNSAHAHTTLPENIAAERGRMAASIALQTVFTETPRPRTQDDLDRNQVRCLTALSEKTDLAQIKLAVDDANVLLTIPKHQQKPAKVFGNKAGQSVNSADPSHSTHDSARLATALDIIEDAMGPNFKMTATGKFELQQCVEEFAGFRPELPVYEGDITNCDGSFSEASFTFLEGVCEGLCKREPAHCELLDNLVKAIRYQQTWRSIAPGVGRYITSDVLASGRKWTLKFNILHVIMCLILAYGWLVAGIFQGDDSVVKVAPGSAGRDIADMGVVLKTAVRDPGAPFEYVQYLCDPTTLICAPLIHRRAAQAFLKAVAPAEFNDEYFTAWRENIQNIFAPFEDPVFRGAACALQAQHFGQNSAEQLDWLVRFTMSYARCSSTKVMNLFERKIVRRFASFENMQVVGAQGPAFSGQKKFFTKEESYDY